MDIFQGDVYFGYLGCSFQYTLKMEHTGPHRLSTHSITKEKYDKINQIVKNWPELERMFLAKCFITLENRVFHQLSMTAEEKYRDLFTTQP
jgi:hypothetical protein